MHGIDYILAFASLSPSAGEREKHVAASQACSKLCRLSQGFISKHPFSPGDFVSIPRTDPLPFLS